MWEIDRFRPRNVGKKRKEVIHSAFGGDGDYRRALWISVKGRVSTLVHSRKI
jgi:hypothetical protein